MPTNYTTKENVENYLHTTFPAAMAAYVAQWLNAVDQWIENYTGKKWKDVASATKYYDTCGGREIYVDNFEGNPTEVCTLDADGDTILTLTIDEDFRTYPWNETTKNKLVLMENGRAGEFETGDKRLKITATFGITTAPADITLAATKLTASVADKYLNGGPLKSESVGDVSFTFADIDQNADALGVYNILDHYRYPTL